MFDAIDAWRMNQWGPMARHTPYITAAGRANKVGAMTIHVASCSCGKLTVAAQGDPVRISICHCLACQRHTGSVFSAQARFPAEKVAVAGQSTTYALVGYEGGVARFHFCPDCGATVFYLLDAMPGEPVRRRASSGCLLRAWTQVAERRGAAS